MNCKECKNNISEQKDGYIMCPISMAEENKVEYDEEKEEFVCDKETI